MQISFIIPTDHDRQNPRHQLLQSRVLPPAGLARMAGHAGKVANINVIDERAEKSEHSRITDIAIIFINSYNQERAIELARHYRLRGSNVVFTGPMLTPASTDLNRWAHTLFLGAGEEILPRYLWDIKSGVPRKVYNALSLNPATGMATGFYGNTALELCRD